MNYNIRLFIGDETVGSSDGLNPGIKPALNTTSNRRKDSGRRPMHYWWRLRNIFLSIYWKNRWNIRDMSWLIQLSIILELTLSFLILEFFHEIYKRMKKLEYKIIQYLLIYILFNFPSRGKWFLVTFLSAELYLKWSLHDGFHA